jgi:exopolysaccharide biosynthesis protein
LPSRSPFPTVTAEPVDTGWSRLAPGVETRQLSVDTSSGRERLRLVRVDPDLTRLRVLYQPTYPRTVSQWAASLPRALAVVNGGYFAADYQTTGLIISDGARSGQSYGDYAGMLAVDTDGQVSLRWFGTRPFNPNETLAQAIQSFPVLVKPGGKMGFPPDADEGMASRRTVVAQDTGGRIILLASPQFRFSLHELAVWLTESDLELDIALNLDGGTSTGLWIKGQENPIDSLIPVPAIIAIEPNGN